MSSRVFFSTLFFLLSILQSTYASPLVPDDGSSLKPEATSIYPLTLEPLLTSKTPYKQAHGVGAVTTVRYNFTCNPKDKINLQTLCTATDNTCNTCYANVTTSSVSNACTTEGSVYRVSPQTISAYLYGNLLSSGTYYIGLYVQSTSANCDGLYCSTDTDTSGVQRLCMQATYNSAVGGSLSALQRLGSANGVLSTPILYAGTQNGNVEISTDGGQSWKPTITQPAPSIEVNSVFISGTTIYAGTQNGNVEVSTDGGQSWMPTMPPASGDAVYSVFVSGTTIYAGTQAATVAVSTDGGKSWTQTTEPDGSEVLSVFVSGTTIYVGTGNGNVYLSTNGGLSWTPTAQQPDRTSVYSIFVSGSTIYASTYSGNVEVSTDGGQTWTATTQPDESAVFSVLVGPNLSLAVYAGMQDGNVEVSVDSGTTWNATRAQPDGTSVNSVFVNSLTIYAGTQNGNVEVSMDGGQSWTPTPIQPAPGESVTSVFVSGTTIYAGSGNGYLYLSTDGGTTWNPTTMPAPSNPYPYPVYSVSVSGTTIYLGSWNYVYLSMNGGTNWMQSTSPSELSGDYVSGLFVRDTTYYVGTANDDGFGGFYTSINNGTNWVAKTSPDGSSVNSVFVSGTTIYAGTQNGNVEYSTDGGENWTATPNQPVPNNPVLSVFVGLASVF